MQVTLLSVGKTNLPFVKEGITLYENRLKHYISFNRVEIPDIKNTKSLSPNEIKDKEADLFIKHIKSGDKIILLDPKGKNFNSIAWAQSLEKEIINSTKHIVFIIGGAYGFSQKIYNIAHDLLSLSNMTFSHQIIRVIFLEQLYRAMTIIKKEPYHNE